jgi:8-oxo-dGTP diphosphatase
MKQFTVTFPVARVEENDYILLGSQREGQPLHGYINGYGGKVDPGESVEVAARRELQQELGIESQNTAYIGSMVHENKEVFFYLSEAEYRDYEDTEEMIDHTWYPLSNQEFIREMLPGDEEIINHVRENIKYYWNGEKMIEFRIEKVGDEIAEAVKKLTTDFNIK